ncbi:hypothetical protein AT575_03335 [Streptococcus penaeicida]|uniref:Uncharacterized protein n=1 Tax=Streptococcus penaeicida TaxID=1765960 RepID=A0A2N8LCQ3_9STRE|nr:hypothetical protein [Streptococcus penaeicida]PND47932.1 hypothetical protein AT575_03335 [Streptococcus penaeicida]
MKIQLINFNGDNINNFNVSISNKFGSPLSLDSFDLNVIDLNHQHIWKSNSPYISDALNIQRDFLSLKNSIEESSRTNYLFLLPQNVHFSYYYDSYHRQYREEVLLKDMLSELVNFHFNNIINKEYIYINYERNNTTINQVQIESDFYFRKDHSGYDLLDTTVFSNHIYSDSSKKLVSFTKERFSFCTLNILNNDQFDIFISKLYRHNESTPIPDWFNNVKLFDDKFQSQIIQEQNNIINQAKKLISLSEEKISKNKYYESILYKTGEELELIIRDILIQLINIDVEFVDKKKEDFYFAQNKIHYLFEFKGLVGNIKNSNISQLRMNSEKFAEENDISYDSCRRILIATRFRNDPLEKRPIIHPDVINYAKNPVNDVLIIDSVELLKLFGLFLESKITTEECLAIFNKTGLFEVVKNE